jgi:hypothetical protein
MIMRRRSAPVRRWPFGFAQGRHDAVRSVDGAADVLPRWRALA